MNLLNVCVNDRVLHKSAIALDILTTKSKLQMSIKGKVYRCELSNYLIDP